jgi:hypothetical protein
MRSRAILPLLAAVCALSAVPAHAARDGWVSYDGGCIGGAKCGSDGWQLRIRLEDETVTAVRFRAHDNVGDRSDGHLRVRLNGEVLDDDIDVPKNGDRFEYPVDRVRGRELLFEAFAHDEVVVEDVEVQYRSGRGDHGGGHGDHGDHGGGGGSHRGDWQSYEDEDGCIGGSRCEGDEIRVRLEDAPVLAVRFHAHDNVGNKSGGHLQVSIDDEALSDDIDVPKDGDDYELDADRTRGRYLIFEALTDDEVVIENIEVQYGSRGRR